MRSLHTLSGFLLVIGSTVATAQAPALPKDIYPDTGNRFPAIKREGATDSFGPGPIRLYSPAVAEAMTGVNDYLRRKSGLEPRLVELAILVTAREMDCAYVWTAHEPAAQKAGLQQSIIDAVKYRRPLTSLGEKEQAIATAKRSSELAIKNDGPKSGYVKMNQDLISSLQ